MRPLEFVLWLNGASSMLGDNPPSAEQWAEVRAKLTETIAPIVAAKLLDKADALVEKERLEQQKLDMVKQSLMQQHLMQQQQLQRHQTYGIASGTSTLGYTLDGR